MAVSLKELGYFHQQIFHCDSGGQNSVGKRPPQKKPQTGKDYGFTLLELMVVLALLTLLIGLVLPGLLKSYQREQERSKIRNF